MLYSGFHRKGVQKISIFSARFIFQNLKNYTVDPMQYLHTQFYLHR